MKEEKKDLCAGWFFNTSYIENKKENSHQTYLRIFLRNFHIRKKRFTTNLYPSEDEYLFYSRYP